VTDTTTRDEPLRVLGLPGLEANLGVPVGRGRVLLSDLKNYEPITRPCGQTVRGTLFDRAFELRGLVIRLEWGFTAPIALEMIWDKS
jgi:hypothetical protein